MEPFLCLAIVLFIILWLLINGTGPDKDGKIK